VKFIEILMTTRGLGTGFSGGCRACIRAKLAFAIIGWDSGGDDRLCS
jgi:hypothetical protein